MSRSFFFVGFLLFFSHLVPSFGETALNPDHLPIETDEKVWNKISDEDGILTYQERNPEHDGVAFRGETTIPASIERLVTVIRDEKIRKEWVDALVEQRKLAQLNPLDQIDYNHSKVPWPFQDRDFVYLAKVKVEKSAPRSLSIVMSSIESPLQPEVKGVVRGQILHAFYVMKEIPGPEPKTQVLIEMALDPKGAIPMWIVNMTQKRWPRNTLRALKRLASRPDLVVPKEIEDYFKGP